MVEELHPIVTAFDPGKTTGVAVREENGDILLDEFEYKNSYNVSRFVRYSDIIVYEDFILRHMKADLTPVKVIGIIEYKAKTHDRALHKQQASQVKGFWTNERLKKTGLYEPGMPHANDALRHLLYFLKWHKKPRILKEFDL